MSDSRFLHVFIVSLVLLISVSPVRAQIVATHTYELNGSLADANGGPSLV